MQKFRCQELQNGSGEFRSMAEFLPFAFTLSCDSLFRSRRALPSATPELLNFRHSRLPRSYFRDQKPYVRV
jgi:hypothetical protein